MLAVDGRSGTVFDRKMGWCATPSATCESEGDLSEPYVECGAAAGSSPRVSSCGSEVGRDIEEEMSVSERAGELLREW